MKTVTINNRKNRIINNIVNKGRERGQKLQYRS